MKTKYKDWAIEKVRECSPPSKEKSTLIAIAKFADPDGGNAYCSIETIAMSSGHSKRTVKRHLRSLELRGEIVTEIHGKKRLRTNMYYIPVCRLTAEEREALTGTSRAQMKLPLPEKPQRSEETEQIFQKIMGDLSSNLSAERAFTSVREKNEEFKKGMLIPKLTESVFQKE